MDFNFNVRFETISDDLVKAYVNDVYIGRVKFGSHKVKPRAFDAPHEAAEHRLCLVFRCSRNPFTNHVPCNRVWHPDYDRFANVAEAVAERDNRDALIPIVIRNALRNYGNELFPQPEDTRTPDDVTLAA